MPMDFSGTQRNPTNITPTCTSELYGRSRCEVSCRGEHTGSRVEKSWHADLLMKLYFQRLIQTHLRSPQMLPARNGTYLRSPQMLLARNGTYLRSPRMLPARNGTYLGSPQMLPARSGTSRQAYPSSASSTRPRRQPPPSSSDIGLRIATRGSGTSSSRRLRVW